MPIRTVLCPTDFTPLSDRAVSLATRICRWYGARLVLEHNLDARPPSFLSVEWMWSEEQKAGDGTKERAAEERLRADVERLAEQFPCEARLTRGPLELGLVAVARALPVDLVVMGSHGWSDARHHSLTERLLDKAPCPLLTLSHESQADRFLSAAEAEPIPVLVPLDLSAHSRATVADALELLERLPLRLHFLHVESSRFEAVAAVADFGRLESLVPTAPSRAGRNSHPLGQAGGADPGRGPRPGRSPDPDGQPRRGRVRAPASPARPRARSCTARRARSGSSRLRGRRLPGPRPCERAGRRASPFGCARWRCRSSTEAGACCWSPSCSVSCSARRPRAPGWRSPLSARSSPAIP